MATTRSLNVDLNGNVASFKTAIDQGIGKVREFQSAVPGIGSALGGVTSTLTSFAGGFAGGFVFKNLIEHAGEAESNMARLSATLRAGGNSSAVTYYAALASEISKLTTFSKGAAINAEIRLNAGGVNDIREALKVSTDLAALFNSDLPSAAETVARALESPAEAYSKLRRAGIALTADEQDRIAQMAETGDAAKAQGAVLDALKNHVGGVAEAMKHTFQGEMADAQKKMESFSKAIGEGGLQAMKFAVEHRQVVGAVAGVTAGVVVLSGAMKALAVAETVAEAMSGPAGWAAIAAGVAAAGVGIVAINKLYDDVGTAAQAAGGAQESLASKMKGVTDAAADQHAKVRDLLAKWGEADFSRGFGSSRLGEMTQEIMKAAAKVEEIRGKLPDAKRLAEITVPPAGSIRSYDPELQARRRADYAAALGAFNQSKSDLSALTAARDREQEQAYTDQRRKEADRFRESSMTPKDKFLDESSRIGELFKGGFLDALTATRALAKAGTEFQSTAKEPPQLAALAEGTNAALLQAAKNSAADKIDPLVKTAQDQLKSQINAENFLRSINAALAEPADQTQTISMP